MVSVVAGVPVHHRRRRVLRVLVFAVVSEVTVAGWCGVVWCGGGLVVAAVAAVLLLL
jgi:hypothetical protein